MCIRDSLPAGAMFVAAFAVAQLALVATQGASLTVGLVMPAAAAGGLLALVFAASRLARRPLSEYGFVVRGPVAATLLFSGLLVMAYTVVEIYPGLLFGFGRAPALPVVVFGTLLLSTPLIALAQEAVYRGFILRSLSRALPFAAIAASAAAFAVQSTNLIALPSLGEVAGGEYLFGTTVANFVLGLVLALQYYKTRWSLLGPVATRTGVSWVQALVPVAARYPNWATSFAALLLAYGVLFALAAVGLREPRLQAHRYLREPFGPRRLRFRERARNRREMRSTAVTVGALAVVLVGATQVAPAVLGASPPLLAIASGSMVPTFHRGTLVVLAHATPGSIHVGTIIAFHVSCLPAPTVHRVYKVLQNGSSPLYLTKGDANPLPDPCDVPFADVIGRVVAIVPYVGLLVLDPLFAAAAVVLIILLALVVPRRHP